MLPVTEKLIAQLRKTNLPLEDRSALTALLLEKVNALPINNTIVLTPHGIQVNGRTLDADQFISFRESCVALNDNPARKVIQEQVRYLAVVEGIHKGLSPEQILFAKTALWNMQKEQELIEEIASYGAGFQA